MNNVQSLIELILEDEEKTLGPEPDCEIEYTGTGVKRVKDSVLKNLSQIKTVAKKPFVYNGQIYTPPNSLQISEGFWQRYGCYLDCGACCAAYSMDYLPDEWEIFGNLYTEHIYDAIIRHYEINGREKQIITFDQDNPLKVHGKEWCQFLNIKTGGCGIHEYNALSCQVELIKFASVGDRSYIRKGPYGRGWAMKKVVDGELGILCDFGPFDEEQFHNNDIPVLKRMKDWADYFEIDTWLPDIIDLLLGAEARGEFKVITIH